LAGKYKAQLQVLATKQTGQTGIFHKMDFVSGLSLCGPEAITVANLLQAQKLLESAQA
jgi:hypothetical protein